LFFLSNTILSAQTIKGNVKNTLGESLSLATIKIVETGEYTTSQTDGNYFLNLSENGHYTIECQHLNYKVASRKVKVINQVVVDFTLYQEPEKLDEVTLTGNLYKPIHKTGDVLHTGSAITQEGLIFQGTTGQNNVLQLLQILPSVNVSSTDAFGMGQTISRIRGQRNMFNSITLEGIPNYGIMPVGGREDLYDRENLDKISLYKGAVSADVLTSMGNRAGTIEASYKKPSDQFNVLVTQETGSDAFYRNFVRIDTGEFLQGESLFLSYTHSQADKWKGAGIAGKRNNLTGGFQHIFNKKWKLDVFGLYNQTQKDLFRPLTYNNIDAYDIDYQANLTGTPSEDLYFYKYNSGTYKNGQYQTKLSYKTDLLDSSLKIYYNHEKAQYSQTQQMGTNYLTLDRSRDLNQWGGIWSIAGTYKNISYGAGYWVESFDNQVFVYRNKITTDGLTPLGYAFYTIPEKRGFTHSPYVKLASQNGNFKWQASIKYFSFNEPAAERFLSEDTHTLRPNPETDLYSNAIQQATWLPSIGIGYQWSKQAEMYINYGRNYMRPYMYVPTVSLYLQNRSQFLAQGKNLQSIFDNWEMETVDNFDLGFIAQNKKLQYRINLFYMLQHNTLAVVYDPIVEVNYAQNTGVVQTYGLEWEMMYALLPSLNVFFNPSYTKNAFTENLNISGSNIEIKSNQLPATPQWMLKSGVLFHKKRWQFNNLVNLTGKRYGDVLNEEKINGYCLWNMQLNYTLKSHKEWLKSIKIGGEIHNVANTRYIGIIDVSDDSQNGEALYYAASPRKVTFSISLDF
jgi:iron complex outermembrane receptor protein